MAGSSPADAWAVGYFTSCLTARPQILIEHWNGENWRRVSAPQLPRTTNLTSVTAISASNAWAVGAKVNDSGHDQTLILHWKGKRRQPRPGRGGSRARGERAGAPEAWPSA